MNEALVRRALAALLYGLPIDAITDQICTLFFTPQNWYIFTSYVEDFCVLLLDMNIKHEEKITLMQ